MFEAAAGTALSVIFLFTWIGLRRIYKCGMIADVVCFGGLTWMFAGTYAGMMTGVISALFISIFLRGLRMFFKSQDAQLDAMRVHQHLRRSP